jgi:hypothetical protein
VYNNILYGVTYKFLRNIIWKSSWNVNLNDILNDHVSSFCLAESNL